MQGSHANNEVSGVVSQVDSQVINQTPVKIVIHFENVNNE